jgi:hypothetical protein
MGAIGAVATSLRLGADVRPLGRAGILAGTWIAGVGPRMVFSFATAREAGPAIVAFSIPHHIIGPAADLSSDECFELLDAYAELELARGAADAETPVMRAHPRGCAACRDDYQSLLALLLEP